MKKVTLAAKYTGKLVDKCSSHKQYGSKADPVPVSVSMRSKKKNDIMLKIDFPQYVFYVYTEEEDHYSIAFKIYYKKLFKGFKLFKWFR